MDHRSECFNEIQFKLISIFGIPMANSAVDTQQWLAKSSSAASASGAARTDHGDFWSRKCITVPCSTFERFHLSPLGVDVSKPKQRMTQVRDKNVKILSSSPETTSCEQKCFDVFDEEDVSPSSFSHSQMEKMLFPAKIDVQNIISSPGYKKSCVTPCHFCFRRC